VKDFIIWLKSGETIQGTATESSLDQLEHAWKLTCDMVGKKIVSFKEVDGNVIIDLARIEAIAINDCKAEVVVVPLTGHENYGGTC